jgi:hypothetical protein
VFLLQTRVWIDFLIPDLAESKVMEIIKKRKIVKLSNHPPITKCRSSQVNHPRKVKALAQIIKSLRET